MNTNYVQGRNTCKNNRVEVVLAALVGGIV